MCLHPRGFVQWILLHHRESPVLPHARMPLQRASCSIAAWCMWGAEPHVGYPHPPPLWTNSSVFKAFYHAFLGHKIWDKVAALKHLSQCKSFMRVLVADAVPSPLLLAWASPASSLPSPFLSLLGLPMIYSDTRALWGFYINSIASQIYPSSGSLGANSERPPLLNTGVSPSPPGPV